MKFSMSNLSLKRRVFVAVALVTVIPLIMLFYYFSGYEITTTATIIASLIVILGWWVVFEVFASIIKVYMRSRAALEDIGESAPAVADEVQSLEAMISLLSDKVKSGFEQLKDFTQMTEELNKEVSRTVLILSTILQANDLFSKDAPADEVIKFIVTHLKHLLNSEICFCVLKDEITDKFEPVVALGLTSSVVSKFAHERTTELATVKERIVVDRYNRPKNYLAWAKELELKNMAMVSICSKGSVVGLILVGNDVESYSFSKDDLEVLNLFSQNVTLIWEHQRLSSKIEELEIVDYLTGLYNERLIIKRLDEEIKRSTVYQRPCGFITVKVLEYEKYTQDHGVIESEKILKKIAKTFKGTLRHIDIAGRIGTATLGAVLIESNRRRSQEVVDELKKALVELCAGKAKLAFAVAESPMHGITSKELFSFARAHSSE